MSNPPMRSSPLDAPSYAPPTSRDAAPAAAPESAVTREPEREVTREAVPNGIGEAARDPVRDAAPSEELLRGVVAVSADAIVCTDDAYRIIMFNPAAERIFGYSRDEMLGQPLDGLFAPGAREMHQQKIARLAADAPDGEPRDRARLWARKKSRALFAAEASVSRVELDAATYFVVVLRDIAPQRRAEKESLALHAREHQARTAAEAAERRMTFLAGASELLHSSLAVEETFDALLHLIVPELADCCAIDVVDSTGRVRRAHVMHGDPAKAAIADRLGTYPRLHTRYLSRRAIEEGEPELVARVGDDFLRSVSEDEDHLGLLRALEISSMIIVPLRTHGRVLGALALARSAGRPGYTQADLSFAQALALRAASALDNARLYDQARRAVRARDDVLGVVSHDLRNPLSVIDMCAGSLLAEGFGDAARDREAMETIARSAHWAQRLIQDLLDVSAIEAGGLSITRRLEDPLMLVTRAVLLNSELAAEREISLVTEVPERLPMVDVDGDRLVQALGNLIGNALKFTPYEGTVRVGAVHEGATVRLYVSDTGSGVPPEHAPHVFDRFWTSRHSARTRGTGMGLAIVRGIVDAHGGRVWLEPPQPGTGATFSIALPVAPARAA